MSSLQIHAKNLYDINFDLFAAGKKITTGRIITPEGKSALLQKTDMSSGALTEIDVVANEATIKGKQGILLKFKVFHSEIGTEAVRSEQELLVLESVPAEIVIGSQLKNKLKITMKVDKK